MEKPMTAPVQEFHFKIQVGGEPGGDVQPEMATEKFIDATRDALDEIVRVLNDTCATFVAGVGALNSKPKECAIEFGVNAGGEAGIPFITKGSLGANFKANLKWVW
jgi:Trypsin-co-occurring domain 1